MSRSVLILTYEFPPSGGAGVQRIAKFARYLPSEGWTPVVVASQPIEGRPLDPTLLNDVHDVAVTRIPGRHVATLVARILAPLKRIRPDRAAAEPAPDGSWAPGTRVPLSARVSRLVAVPDDAAFWIGPAVREAVRLGRAHHAAAVLASGPPQSVFVAGERVARALGVPFVADMRDCWRDNPGAITPTEWHARRQNALEREVLTATACVIAASHPVAEEAREMGAAAVEVIPNGFDPADVPRWAPEPGPLTLAYMGRFYGVTDPADFLEAFAEARATVPECADMRLVHIGPPSEDLDAAAVRIGISDAIVSRGYLPHGEALAETARADVGLVVVAEGPRVGTRTVATAKLFEYLGIGMPVMLSGPLDGLAASIVRECDAGVAASGNDRAAGVAALAAFARAKSDGSARGGDAGAIAAYDRRRHAARVGSVLTRVTGG